MQLTPTRPLRSEVERERRLSRPPSGQFLPGNFISSYRFNGSGSASNRNSIGTTDSTASEEDAVPPPLPQKNRNEADYCNLPDMHEFNIEATAVENPWSSSFSRIIQKVGGFSGLIALLSRSFRTFKVVNDLHLNLNGSLSYFLFRVLFQNL